MKKKGTANKAQMDLAKLREEINAHDKALLGILKKRFLVVKKVALLKKKHNLPVLQKARWKIIIEDRVKTGLRFGLNPDFSAKLMKLIHKESVRYQISLQYKKGTKNE